LVERQGTALYGLAEDSLRSGQEMTPNELYSQSAIYIVAAHALRKWVMIPSTVTLKHWWRGYYVVSGLWYFPFQFMLVLTLGILQASMASGIYL
jgi:hypothetical protein